MKTTIHLIVLTFLILIFGHDLWAQKIPKYFSITFKFGYHEKDATIFESGNDKLIVHGIDTLMTFKMKLSKAEKQAIYNELVKMNYIDYPEKYHYQHSDSEEVYISGPCQHYFLTVNIKHEAKSIEWDNCTQAKTKDEKHKALMQFDRVVEKIIWSKNPLKDYNPRIIYFDPD